MAKTHYAAVKDGIVVGTRSSASRHVDGVGRFGPYVCAVLQRERVLLLASGVTTETEDVISWHGTVSMGIEIARARNAEAGRSWTIDYEYRPRETHHTTTYLGAEMVPVIVTPRPLKVGAVLAVGAGMEMGR